MKRLVLTFLAIISFVLGVSAAIGIQAAPALADTTIPMYGCGGAPYVTDYNGNPIGGGVGYSPTYSAADADFVVDTAAELKSALASATSGDIVYVADGATITLNSTTSMYGSSVGFNVPAGVTLAGGRGGSGVTGGIIRLASGFQTSSEYTFIRANADSIIGGLHIDTGEDTNAWFAIHARGDNAEIFNNEIHGFGHSAVRSYYALNMWVHHNYIHNILDSDGMAAALLGSKFSVGDHASALVEGNYFNNNTQTMGASRGLCSYIFRYNYVGPDTEGKIISCYGQNDNNGSYLQKTSTGEYEWPAGENIEVYNNTSMSTGDGFLRFSGVPTSSGFHSVHNNWACETKTTLYSGSGGLWGPICQQLWYMPEYRYNAPRDAATESWGHHPWVRMEEYDNWWGTALPPSSPYSPSAPLYGCGGAPYVTDYDGNPIGGGEGYSRTYSTADADFVVDTAAELKSALASATSGDIVYVADGAVITLNSDGNMYIPSVAFIVPAGVTLAGGRGRNGVTGGIIRLASGFHTNSEYTFIRANTGSRIGGLHIDTCEDTNAWFAIHARGDNAEIFNSEIHGFGNSAVRSYYALNMWVHHNYIHNILGSNGMAVAVLGSKFSVGDHASALVEGNYFNNNTQTTGASRGLCSYIFRYNYVGPDTKGKVIDCHGQNDDSGSYLQKTSTGEYEWPAGENIEVYNNTSMSTGSGFLRFRGVPTSSGFHSVHNNWTYETKTTLYGGSGGLWAPICQQLWYMPEYRYNAPRDAATESWGHHPWVRMEEYDNWWGTTPPPSSK